MGKSRKSTQQQQIDPSMRRRGEEMQMLAKLFSSLGYQPYEGNTIADLTPMQKTAMNAPNLAASAFNMPTAEVSTPTGATEDGTGISGFSPEMMMRKSAPNYDKLKSFLEQFYKQASS